MYASQRGNIMENKKDLTKTSLIDLVKKLSEIDNKLDECLLIKKSKLDIDIEQTISEYNDIIKEIHRRFPPLVNDVNLQPKVVKK